ncbi:MAG: twin-arginine translocase subunit TatC [archaeon]|jgi:sec-independent protein translocase protein TatC
MNEKPIANFISNFADNPAINEIRDLVKMFIGPLKRTLIVFFIFLIIGGFFSNNIIDFFKALLPTNVILVAFNPAEVFVSVFTIIIGFSIVFTTPYFLFEVIRFVSPALYAKEKKTMYKIIPISAILFIGGAIFGISIMAFFGLIFFSEFATSYGIQNMWSLSGLVNALVGIAIAFGIAFQLPIITVILVKQKMIALKTLQKLRYHIIIILLIISAFLTPPDVVSQVLMATPLYLLYEGTLLYLKVTNNNSNK